MKQKKTMRLWQMIIMLVLSVIMVITMFLPAFRIDSNMQKKQIKVIQKDEGLLEKYEKYLKSQIQSAYSKNTVYDAYPREFGFESENGGLESEGLAGEGLDNLPSESMDSANEDISEDIIAYMEKIVEEYDEEVKEYEEEYDVHISKISPFRIMTHSFEKLIIGNKLTEEEIEEGMEENEDFAKFKGIHNKLRVMLWIVYILVLIIILLCLSGFFLKWNKFIPLIVNCIYGIIATIIFGYLRFGFMKTVAKKTGDMCLETLRIPDLTPDEFSKLLSCHYSIAFLLAFIVAILFILVSVVSMLTGNAAVGGYELENDLSIGNEIQTIADGGIAVQGGNSFYGQGKEEAIQTQPAKIPVESITKQLKASQAQKAQPMGQVRCTKGSSAGQGFMLPHDRKVIVGKSPQNANLIINNQNVSNIHCSIRYNPGMNTYIIKDHSMNGTFVNGVRLQKDVAIEYPAGTVLSLADGSNEITLG